MTAPPIGMTSDERRASASLASLFGFRMLGLFLILPVLSVAARHLTGGTSPMLVGLALGAYGLTQAFFQIPFGMASDRVGRKPIIALGLLIFAFGSFVAAFATSIAGVILGRVLQGAGAISSTLIALTADLTRAEHRTKAMATIGSSVGLAFALALIIAPPLYHLVGLGGMFFLTGVLSFAAIGALYAFVPKEPPRHAGEPPRLKDVPVIARDPELLRLNLGIFVLNVSQVALFVVVPPLLVSAGLPLAAHWEVYLPVLIISFAVLVPAVLYADRQRQHKRVLLASVAALALVETGFALAPVGLVSLALLLTAFFAVFNVLEALLPSLVSRVAPEHARGTALATYNTAQTLGLFIGGLAGGALAGAVGPSAVFGFCAVLALLWLFVATFMRPLAAR